MGKAVTAYGYSGMRDTRFIISAAPTSASVTMATAGRPDHSSSIASRKLRDVQDPQSPMATRTASVSWMRRRMSSGAGGTETLGLQTLSAPATETPGRLPSSR